MTENYKIKKNIINLSSNVIIGFVVGCAVLFATFVAIQNPWVEDHYKIVNPYYAGEGINMHPTFPKNVDTNYGREKLFTYLAHQITLDESKKTFIVDAQCLQDMVFLGDSEFENMLTYLDIYHNYGKSGNQSLIQGDIERRLDFFFTDNFEKIALFGRGYPFIEGKISFVKARANLFNKYSIEQASRKDFLSTLDMCSKIKK